MMLTCTIFAHVLLDMHHSMMQVQLNMHHPVELTHIQYFMCHFTSNLYLLIIIYSYDYKYSLEKTKHPIRNINSMNIAKDKHKFKFKCNEIFMYSDKGYVGIS